MNALVLSGGASKGSWQSGCINRVLELYPNIGLIAGCSVGTLNGGLLAQGRWSDMLGVWGSMSNGEVYTGANFIDETRDLIYYKCVFRTQPLWEKIQKYFHKADFKIPFRFGFVSNDTGKYYSVTPDDFADDLNLQLAVLASASMPVVFPPVPELYLKDGTHLRECVDGGVAHVSPLGDVVDANPDLIIELSCQTIGDVWADTQSGNNVVTTIERDLSLLEYYQSAFDRKGFVKFNNAAKENGGSLMFGGKVYKYIPLITITPSIQMDSLDFNHAKEWQEQGYKDANSILKSDASPETAK